MINLIPDKLKNLLDCENIQKTFNEIYKIADMIKVITEIKYLRHIHYIQKYPKYPEKYPENLQQNLR